MNQSHNGRKPLAPRVGAEGNSLTLGLKPRRGVCFVGPQPDQDSEGDEIPVCIVYIGDEAADPVAKVYTSHSFHGAEALALCMAKDRHLDPIQDAMPRMIRRGKQRCRTRCGGEAVLVVNIISRCGAHRLVGEDRR